MSIIKKGSELIFISRIKKDGTGVEPVSKALVDVVYNEEFELKRLSITEDTYIAFNMSVFVVKIKK